MKLHLVAAGALVGAPLRFLVDTWLTRRYGRRLPWGTLAVNLLGSALLGLLIGLAAAGAVLALLGAGLCGAFTTASTFAWELVELLERRRPGRAAAYATVSLLGGTGLAYAALLLGRGLSG